MISTLKGELTEKTLDQVILECGGVGYGVNVSVEDYGALNVGDTVKLSIHEHIREASHDLFGFTSAAAKLLFEQLLSVNGVGPKMALSILSIASLNDVRRAIAEGDTKFIARANGVGKRVAERVVVDLKDKVGLLASSSATDFLNVPVGDPADEAMQGLIGLGYSPQDASEALAGVDPTLSVEDRIRQALKA